MMNTKMNRRIPGSAVIYRATFIGLLLIPCTALAQTTAKPMPVIVTNTTTTPVPVTGRVDVGTPTVKLDPNNNTVRMDPSVSRIDFYGFTHSWAQGQTYTISQVTDKYSRLKICVKNLPTSSNKQSARVSVLSRNVNVNSDFAILDFEIGNFFASQLGEVVCNVYDLPGYQTFVVIDAPLNMAGTVSVGLWAQPT